MLMYAIKLQNLDIIKFLIDNKANLKVLDSYERDIMQLATLLRDDKILNYFIGFLK